MTVGLTDPRVQVAAPDGDARLQQPTEHTHSRSLSGSGGVGLKPPSTIGATMASSKSSTTKAVRRILTTPLITPRLDLRRLRRVLPDRADRRVLICPHGRLYHGECTRNAVFHLHGQGQGR